MYGGNTGEPGFLDVSFCGQLNIVVPCNHYLTILIPDIDAIDCPTKTRVERESADFVLS